MTLGSSSEPPKGERPSGKTFQLSHSGENKTCQLKYIISSFKSFMFQDTEIWARWQACMRNEQSCDRPCRQSQTWKPDLGKWKYLEDLCPGYRAKNIWVIYSDCQQTATEGRKLAKREACQSFINLSKLSKLLLECPDFVVALSSHDSSRMLRHICRGWRTWHFFHVTICSLKLKNCTTLLKKLHLPIQS